MVSRTLTGASIFGESTQLLFSSLPPGIFHNSAVVMMPLKLPDLAASWQVSFHSGWKGSAEKLHPEAFPVTLWLQQGANTFLPNQLIPYGTSTATTLPTYRTQWTSTLLWFQSVTKPSVWEWGGGRGRAGATTPGRDTEEMARGTHRGPLKKGEMLRTGRERRENGKRPAHTAKLLTDKRGRGKGWDRRTGQRRARRHKKRGERKTRLGLGVLTVSSDLSKGHRHTAGF